MTVWLRRRAQASLIVGMLAVVGGCTGAEIRVSLNPQALKPNPRLAVVSNSLLADAIGLELVRYGFTIVERSRLQAVLVELELSLSGITREEDFRKVGEILNVDGLVFVGSTFEPHFPSKVGSAMIKIVDVRTGTLAGGVTYQNGRGGLPGSPADAGTRESLPETARRIAKAIAQGLGRR